MRLGAMIKKEFRQIFRDRRILFLLIIFPAALLLLFGYALSFDVRHIKTGVLDLDHSERSRELTRSFTSNEYFDLIHFYSDQKDVERGLDSGEISIGIIIPLGFEKQIVSGGEAVVQSLIDGSNSQSATIFQGYLKAFVMSFSMKVVLAELRRVGYDTLTLPVALEPRVWYNPELKSSNFLVPGLIVFILMISCVISTALSVVRERERGTIEQLLVSPLHAPQIIVGKTIPYIFISLLSASIVLTVGHYVFEVPIRGDLLMLFFASTIFIITALSQGILVSTVTSSQQVAFQVSAFISILPSILLSGFVFPIRNMPVAIQVVTYIVPARYFVTILRAVLLKGAGIEAYWRELIALFVYTLFMLGIAMRRMSRVKLV